MTNLDSVLKSRDIALLTKIHIVKAMLFSVIMYLYKSWTIKKAEHQRTDACKLRCWRRCLRVPWITRRSNQLILKEINFNIHLKDWSWSSNTLATWCEGVTHLKRPWYWERMKAGGEVNDRGWDGLMASLTWWTWGFEQAPGVGDGQGSLACCSPWGYKSWTGPSNWTKFNS